MLKIRTISRGNVMTRKSHYINFAVIEKVIKLEILYRYVPRVTRNLKRISFLNKIIPYFSENWPIGTCKYQN